MVDVLGRELDAARSMLAAAGFQVQVEETRTPRRVGLEGPLRVVRQVLATDQATVRLVVTRERYVPAAPRDAE